MAFEELKESTQNIQEETKAYVDTTVQYYKLRGFRFLMKSSKVIVKVLFISFFLMLAVVFGSVAAAVAIGNAIDSMALGFLIIAGAYFVLLLLILFLRLKFIEKPLLETFSKLFFNE